MPRLHLRTLPVALALVMSGAMPVPPLASQAAAAADVAARAFPADPRIDALFASWDKPESPGAAVAVVRNGEIVYARGYGQANLEYGVPITPASVFHIASISKHFTTFAINLLAQDGKLSLDDDIRMHLPEAPDLGRAVTIRQMIHHTSGLRDQWELLAMAGWRLDDVITREHILKKFVNQRELNFEPGAEYLYSNMGYTLLAEIVARVSGQSFRQFTHERIFAPLGMTRTHFHDDHQEIVPNRAYSYAPRAGGGFRNAPLNYANVGATSLFTTVEDLAKWDRNFYTAQVGGAAVLEQMLERGVLNDGSTIPYAHALVWGEYRGLPTVGHGGADAGYRTAFLRFPEQQLSVVVFSNLSSFNPSRLAQQVAEVYLESEMQPVVELRRAEPPSRRVRMATAELERLVGVYANPLNDQLRRLELRDGRLVLALGTGYELAPVARNRFVGVGTPISLELEAEPARGGPVIRLRELSDAGEPAVFERVVAPSEAELAAYAGSYYSRELGTTYTLVLRDGQLFAEHRRHEDSRLTPTLRDRFAGENWWFRRVEFSRDEAGRVDGFLLTGGRVRNLRFDRVDG
jgi:CubicO group peptidase (beta-lactamase class C family)